jgi:hypothetical protein
MSYKDLSKQREYLRVRRAKRRADAIEKRGGKCIKCSSTERLEFHHRSRETKTDHRVWTWKKERQDKELDKCDLLCKKCHNIETTKENDYEIRHGTSTEYRHGCRCEPCKQAKHEENIRN